MKKIFRIVVNLDDESGMNAISLVEFPAVERNFLKFNKEENIVYKFNQEKRIITGVVCEADKPIYRFNKEIGEYYVVFEKDTIRTMVEKYSSAGLFNSVNLQHDSYVDGVVLVESYIIDKERGLCPNEFKDVSDGSWIASFKIENDELWNDIKNGKELNGFSLEGLFELEEMKFSKVEQLNPLEEIMKLSKIALRNLILRFEDVSTDKGVLTIDGDVVVGASVFVGEEPADDGEYAMEDGKVLVIAEGKIAEIKEEVVEEPKEEVIVEAEGEEEEVIVEPEADKIAELEAKIAELQKENEELRVKLGEKEAECVAKEEEIAMSVEKYVKNQKETPKKSTFKSYLR